MRFAALLPAASFVGSAFAGTVAAAGTLSGGSGQTAGDFFVRSLPGQPDGPFPKMHAGYVVIMVASFSGYSDLQVRYLIQAYRDRLRAQWEFIFLAYQKQTYCRERANCDMAEWRPRLFVYGWGVDGGWAVQGNGRSEIG